MIAKRQRSDLAPGQDTPGTHQDFRDVSPVTALRCHLSTNADLRFRCEPDPHQANHGQESSHRRLNQQMSVLSFPGLTASLPTAGLTQGCHPNNNSWWSFSAFQGFLLNIHPLTMLQTAIPVLFGSGCFVVATAHLWL